MIIGRALGANELKSLTQTPGAMLLSDRGVGGVIGCGDDAPILFRDSLAKGVHALCVCGRGGNSLSLDKCPINLAHT